MKRTNIYLTETQVRRLSERSTREGLSIAELVRRAVDAFLAWDDPTYRKEETKRNAHSSPA